jgi:drug/metabolite transporter (DMT)-like permease
MKVSHHPQRRRAILMLVLATLYWGVSFPIIKSIAALTHVIVPGAGTWFLASATVAPRFAIATVVVLIFNLRGPWLTRLEVMQGARIGAFGAMGALFQTDGLQYTEASTSAFLTQMSAILIPTVLAIRHHRSPGFRIWTACLLVLAGVAVLGHVSWDHLGLGRGEWESLLCSAFYVGQILSVNDKGYSSNRPGRVTLVMFAAQAAIFIGLAAFTAPSTHALVEPWASGPWTILSVILALVCTVGAFSLMNKWQPKISSTEAGLIYCIEPLFASIFALFVPVLLSRWTGLDYHNEHFTWSLLVGGGLVTFANIMVLTGT